MRFFTIITPVFTLAVLCGSHATLGQQPYTGAATSACSQRGNSNSILGYTCNGLNPSCQAYLTFRAKTLYNSVPTISSLLGADPSRLSEANSVSQDAIFETNKLVIVPVNCSCAGDRYYQFNASHVVENGDGYFSIANNTFEGLSTCQAMMDQNSIPELDLSPGEKLRVPIRCACPTKNQTEEGVKYLLSYSVTWGDEVSQVSGRFGISAETTLDANGLSFQKPTINPFTTLLLPLRDKPSSSQTVEPPLPPPPPPSSPPPPPSSDGSSSKTWVYVVVGVVVGGVALTSVLCAVIFKKQRRESNKRKDDFAAAAPIEKPEEKKKKKFEEGSETLSEIISGMAQSFKVYGFKELLDATDGFSPGCSIKGRVYRGVINGDLAAIKRVNGDVSKEIELLSKVNHSNVIRLSGVSFNEGYWYLVYEYAANGPLSDWIHLNNVNGKFLSWTQRIQIALDVATGLDYLHNFTHPPHVHKDLRCGNILLDGDFRAKVANLGLARPVEGEGDEFPTTRHIVGTRGYMAPEYLENGMVSTKLDVYAFGVMMVELLTGREAAAVYVEDNKNLSNVLSAILSEDGEHEKLREFMDPSLQGNYATELAIFVAGMMDNCIKKDPASRPSMQELVSFLSKALDSSLSWEASVNISRLPEL